MDIQKKKSPCYTNSIRALPKRRCAWTSREKLTHPTAETLGARKLRKLLPESWAHSFPNRLHPGHSTCHKECVGIISDDLHHKPDPRLKHQTIWTPVNSCGQAFLPKLLLFRSLPFLTFFFSSFLVKHFLFSVFYPFPAPRPLLPHAHIYTTELLH